MLFQYAKPINKQLFWVRGLTFESLKGFLEQGCKALITTALILNFKGKWGSDKGSDLSLKVTGPDSGKAGSCPHVPWSPASASVHAPLCLSIYVSDLILTASCKHSHHQLCHPGNIHNIHHSPALSHTFLCLTLLRSGQGFPVPCFMQEVTPLLQLLIFSLLIGMIGMIC